MSRIPTLAAICFSLTLLFSAIPQEANATWWSSSRVYSSAYFHDYYNYGARYSHRPYGYYHSYYGARTYAGVSPTGYYGGWSTYAPYAYTPDYYAGSYGYGPSTTQHVSYGSPFSYGSSVSNGCSTCSGVSVPVAAPVVASYGCAPTCCDANVAYAPGCFSGGSRRGLLGPLCPFRRASYNYGTCGSFGDSSGCGW